MKFVLWNPDRQLDREVILVDCNTPRLAGLNLDHHFGQRTPAELRCDLATETVLRYLDAGPSTRYSVASCDHYDTDGVLSVFALLVPDAARERRELLIECATVGDFFEPTSDRALQVSLALQDELQDRSALQPRAQRLEWSYRTALGMLPRLLDHPEEFREYWEPRFQRLQQEQEMLARIEPARTSGEFLCVIEVPHPLSEFGMVAAAHRAVLLSASPGHAGGLDFVAIVKMRYSWGYELASDPAFPPLDLWPAARRLQRLERRGGGHARWDGEQYEALTWRVHARGSSLPLAQVEQELRRVLEPTPRKARRQATRATRLKRKLERAWMHRFLGPGPRHEP